MRNKRKIAIIGVGPRGLSALEKLILSLNKNNSLQQIEILLFEETNNFGNGPVYEIHQTKANWINISERILYLEERKSISLAQIQIPAFPSYHEWSGKDYDNISEEMPDIYPPRQYVGRYLNQRFHALFEPLKELDIVSLVNQRVDSLEMKDSKIILYANNNESFLADEVLLTIGHQPTRLSKQMKDWKSFTADHKLMRLVSEPYPIREILSTGQLKPGSTIALRGFGLAMIDVVRAIAEKFGTFVTLDKSSKSLAYKTDFSIKNLFVPFSLDGLPPSPKPLNAQIDQWFEPATRDLMAFEQILSDKQRQKKAKGIPFLIDAIAPIVAKVYLSLPQFMGKGDLNIHEVEAISKAWLQDDKYQHFVITPHQQATEKSMKDFVGMAMGNSTISLDFCIGQVWRHCQPYIYQALSFNECSEEVFAKIISLDERMKRYAYGPPVESIQQLLALVEAGVMNLSVLNDPSIDLTEKGWLLSCGEASLTAGIMINTVLDSPRLESVSSSIIKNLLSKDLIQAVHDDLGVYTDTNAYVVSNRNDEILPIALLGRLAKGTIIGVDAILECFGDRPKQWASKASERHRDWIIKNKN